MNMSNEYSAALRKRLVQRFVQANSRSPTSAELLQLIRDEETKYYAVDEVGISGFDLARPKFRDSSSVTLENINRDAIYTDLMILNKKLDKLIDIEESSYRGALSSIYRTNKTLDELSERLDNLLLIYGQDDIFLHGIEETFSHQQFVNRTNTTATIEPSAVTLGKRRLDIVDLSTVKLKATPVASKGFVSYQSNSPVTFLTKDDGNVWSATIKTTYQLGRVSLGIELTLDTLTDVSCLKLSGLPIENNKPMTCTVFYSTNGSVFNPIQPVETRFVDSMIIPVGVAGIKKFQIFLSKDAADISDVTKNEYQYLFMLDKIVLEQSSFEPDTKSVVELGPYNIIDTNGEPVYFSKATLKGCTVEPLGTGIAFYMSTDNANWLAVNHKNTTSSYVTFGDHTISQAIDYVDTALSPYALVQDLGTVEDYEIASEAYLNTYVIADYAALVSSRNITIQRNISYDVSEVLGTSSGWNIDTKTGSFSTVIYISNPEGRFIDFGPKGALLNNVLVTGNTWIKQGYSKFVVDSSSWQTVDTVTTETALKAADALYPYNCKYLIEGYAYTDTFTGEKVYSGVDTYFGRQLSYISFEEFEILESGAPNYYQVFTIENIDDRLYFKVKIDSASSTWRNEYFSIDFVVQSAKSNQVYVKAILSSTDQALTPIIESFKVRVV